MDYGRDQPCTNRYNGIWEGVLAHWWVCGAKEVIKKLGVKNKRRKNLKTNMGRN
jgi:hypothetical protein